MPHHLPFREVAVDAILKGVWDWSTFSKNEQGWQKATRRSHHWCSNIKIRIGLPGLISRPFPRQFDRIYDLGSVEVVGAFIDLPNCDAGS